MFSAAKVIVYYKTTKKIALFFQWTFFCLQNDFCERLLFCHFDRKIERMKQIMRS
jgi:hypothetical protein